MNENTPTPWADPGEHKLTGYGDINHVIVGDDGKLIGSIYANCFNSGHMTDLPTLRQASANAAIIVRAVNNHETLVKFLKILLAHDDRFQVAVGGNPRVVDAMLAEGRALLGDVGSPVLTHEKGPGHE